MHSSQMLVAVTALLVTSCTKDIAPQTDEPLAIDLQRLDISAHVDTGTWGIRAVAEVRNRTTRSITFGVAAFHCAIDLQLYRNDTVLWSQMQIPRTGGCKWLPQTVTLQPGALLTLRSEDNAPSAILGDSLPEGQYAARVRVIFARLVPSHDVPGALTTQIDTVATISAGSVQLRQ